MEQLVHTFLLMLEGTEITLEIFFVTLILSLPIGMLAALGRLSSIKLISRIVEFYIWIMRGTPLMLQLLFVYFALPMIGISTMWLAVFGDVGVSVLAILNAMRCLRVGK